MVDIPYHPPHTNPTVIGHNAALLQLYQMYDSSSIANAILLTGPRGIGKATLAYHFINTVFSGDKGALEGSAHSINETSRTFSQIRHASHPDLRVLELSEEKGAKKTISVDKVRQVQHFLHHTATETAYRIVLIDSADDLNNNAANALLKLLEEPPANAFFILISHAPSKLLPTIKSRCREVKLLPLESEDNLHVLRTLYPDINSDTWLRILPSLQHTPGRAIEFVHCDGMTIYQKLLEFLDLDTDYNITLLHSIAADVVSHKEWSELRWRYFMLSIRHIVRSAILEQVGHSDQIAAVADGEQKVISQLKIKSGVEKLLKLWNKIELLERETSHLNLDKRLVLITICEMLRR